MFASIEFYIFLIMKGKLKCQFKLKEENKGFFLEEEITLFEVDIVIYSNRLKKTVLTRLGSV